MNVPKLRIELNLLAFLSMLMFSLLQKVHTLEPQFDSQIINVTVVKGHEAILPCTITHLGNYYVMWEAHDGAVLTFKQNRVTSDQRFRVERPYIQEWNLHIQNVQKSDSGRYRCVVNTNPTRRKEIDLYVKVRSEIIEELSSPIHITSREGETIILMCNVTGAPYPVVTWFRRPALDTGAMKETIGVAGEVLVISNVSRYCDDIYECVAFNGVPPAVSREMRVTVEFPPEVYLNTQGIGQAQGKDTILECRITSYPLNVNYWKFINREIINTPGKYRLEAYDAGTVEWKNQGGLIACSPIGDRTLTLSLTILNIDEYDYGDYTCVAGNSLGLVEQTMNLYQPTTTTELQTTIQTIKTKDPNDQPSSERSPTPPIIVIKPKTDGPLNPLEPTPKYNDKTPQEVKDSATSHKLSAVLITMITGLIIQLLH